MLERQLKAALFDLDGVVFDTEPQYSVFWGEQCRLYHPEHPGLEQEIKGSTLTSPTIVAFSAIKTSSAIRGVRISPFLFMVFIKAILASSDDC